MNRINLSKFKITKILNRRVILLVLALLAFRVAVVLLTINNIPPTSEFETGQWFYNGADGDGYFSAAKDLFSGNLRRDAEPVGLTLIYAPIILFTQAATLYDIITLMALIYGVLFNMVATILVFLVAKRFLDNQRKALSAAILFQIYPYLFYLSFYFIAGHSQIISQFASGRFIQLSFLHIASDPWSMILTLSSLLLIFSITGEEKSGTKKSLALGLLTGWAAITRLQNFILLPVYAIILLYYRKFRTLVLYLIGALPMLALQGFANRSVSGSFFKFSSYDYIAENKDLPPLFSWSYPFKLIQYPLSYNPWLFVPMAIGIMLLAVGAIVIIRTKKQAGILLAVYTFSIIAVLLFHWPTYTNPRYFFPVLPAFFIYAFTGIEYFVKYFKSAVMRHDHGQL